LLPFDLLMVMRANNEECGEAASTPTSPLTEDGKIREECGCCGTLSFEANTKYSLIAAGWRLIPVSDSGKSTVVWSCPKCWRSYKEKVVARKQPALPASGRARRMTTLNKLTPGSRVREE
jgi:hypothetical protein